MASTVAVPPVVVARCSASASRCLIAPTTRPRTRPESRKRTSALAGWTLTSTSRGSQSTKSATTACRSAAGNRDRPRAARPTSVLSRTARPLTKTNWWSAFGRLKVGRPIRPASRTPSRAASSVERIGGEFVAERLPQPLRLARFARRRRPASRSPTRCRSQGKADFRDGSARGGCTTSADRLRLGAVGFQKLEPRGRRGEEVARLDPRAERLAAGLDRALDPVLDQQGGAPSARRRRGCGFRAATPRRSTAAPRRGSRTSRWRSGRRREFSRSRGARRRARDPLRPCRARRR